MQSGVKTLAHLLSRAGMDNLLGLYEGGSSTSADRDEAKKLDVIAVSFSMPTRSKAHFTQCPQHCTAAS